MAEPVQNVNDDEQGADIETEQQLPPVFFPENMERSLRIKRERELFAYLERMRDIDPKSIARIVCLW